MNRSLSNLPGIRTIDQIIDEKVFDETEKDADMHFRKRSRKAVLEKGKIGKLLFGEGSSGGGEEKDPEKTSENEKIPGASGETDESH